MCVVGADLSALDVNAIRCDTTIMQSLLRHKGAVIMQTELGSPAPIHQLRAVRVG